MHDRDNQNAVFFYREQDRVRKNLHQNTSDILLKNPVSQWIIHGTPDRHFDRLHEALPQPFLPRCVVTSGILEFPRASG